MSWRHASFFLFLDHNRSKTCQPKHGLAVGVFRVLATEDQQERAFHKCLADLLKLRAEKQKAEIGFASRTRKQEMHAFDLLFRQAEIDHEQVRMSSVKCDIYCQERRLEAAIERENRAEQAKNAA